MYQRLVHLVLAVKRLKKFEGQPHHATCSSACPPSDRRSATGPSLPPCVRSCCEGDAARDYWVVALSLSEKKKKTEGTGEERASRVPPEATGRAGTFLGSPYISRSTAAPLSGPMAPDRRRPNDLTWPLKIR